MQQLADPVGLARFGGGGLGAIAQRTAQTPDIAGEMAVDTEGRLGIERPVARDCQRAGQSEYLPDDRLTPGKGARDIVAFGIGPCERTRRDQPRPDHHRRDIGRGPFDPSSGIGGKPEAGNRTVGQLCQFTERQARGDLGVDPVFAALKPELGYAFDQRRDFAAPGLVAIGTGHAVAAALGERERLRLAARRSSARRCARLFRTRQAAVMHAQPCQQRFDIERQIAAQAQKAARAHRQARDQRGPVLDRKLGPAQRGNRDIGFLIGEVRGQIGAAEAPAGLADDGGALGRRDRFGERVHP